MTPGERALREAIVRNCRAMAATGFTPGTSGNISARYGDVMLLTPSATPYDQLEPEMLATLPLEGPYGAWEGPLEPSTEWRFHLDILMTRRDVNAVVHAHPTYATVLAIARRDIPAVHYMMAAFGGTDIRCSGYGRYGSKALAIEAVKALEGRHGCLLANHGMIALGDSVERAMWRAGELEILARQFFLALQIGGPVILDAAALAETAAAFDSYGLRDEGGATAPGSSEGRGGIA